jgi:hypothetical protein
MKTIACPLAVTMTFLPVVLPSNLAAQIRREIDPFVEEAIESKPYTQLTDHLAVRFGGTLEPEYGWGGDVSDAGEGTALVLINPGIEASVDDWLVLFGAIEFNIEPEDNALLVDELYFEAASEAHEPLSLKGGYYTSPFGDFETLHDASPLPEAAFEAKGDVIELAFSQEQAGFNAYAFRGRRDWVLKQFSGNEEERQHQDWRWGAGVYYQTLWENFGFAADFGITSAIFSSNELIYDVPDRSGGLGANARIGFGFEDVSLWMQYVSALETVGIRNDENGAIVPSVPAAFAVELDVTRSFVEFATFFLQAIRGRGTSKRFCRKSRSW